MKAYWWSGDIAPRILDVGTRLAELLASRPGRFTQGKKPLYPLDRGQDGPQIRSGLGGEDNNSQHLPKLGLPIIHPAAQAYTTQISRLLIMFNFICIKVKSSI
jgi:hypothetical protein